MESSGIFTQSFANLPGKRHQGIFIRKTRIYMLQTIKYDTEQLICKKLKKISQIISVKKTYVIYFLFFLYSTIFTQRTFEKTLCRSINIYIIV